MERVVILARKGISSTLLSPDGRDFRAWNIGESGCLVSVLSVAEANLVISRTVEVLTNLDDDELPSTFVAHHGSDGSTVVPKGERIKLLAQLVEFSHGPADRWWNPCGQNLLDELQGKPVVGMRVRKALDDLLNVFKGFDRRVRSAAIRFLGARLELICGNDKLEIKKWADYFSPANCHRSTELSELPAIANQFLAPDWADGLNAAYEEILKDVQAEGATTASILSPNGGFCRYRDELLGSDDGEVTGIARKVRDAIEPR